MSVVLTLVTVFTNTCCKAGIFAKQGNPSPPDTDPVSPPTTVTTAKTEGATANVGTIPIL